MTLWTVAHQSPLSMEFSRQEWVAISYSREFSWPRDWTWVSCIAGSFFTIWATPGGMGRTLQPLLSPLIWEASMYPERTGASLFSKMECWEESEWIGLAKFPQFTTLSPITFFYDFLSSVQFSCSVVSDFLRPPGVQHARLPCPSPIPGACSNSCPLS